MIRTVIWPLRFIFRIQRYIRNGEDIEHRQDQIELGKYDEQLRELNGWKKDDRGRDKGSL